MEQNKNFTIRLKASIDKRMGQSGINDRLLKASKHWEDYDQSRTAFFASLEDITLNHLQGVKAEQPSPSPVEVDETTYFNSRYEKNWPWAWPSIKKNDFKHEIECAFLAGRMAASSGETMRWVKASERLPNKVASYWCKLPDADGGKCEMIFKPAGFFITLLGVRPLPENIEWLDESASPTDTREEERAFLEWVSDKYYYAKYADKYMEYAPIEEQNRATYTLDQLRDLYSQSLNK